MADKDREADEAKRRAEEEDEDEALAGKGGDADEAEGDDEAEEPVAKPAKEAPAAAKPASKADRPAPQRKNPRLAQRRQPPKGSLAKSLMLFVIIVGGLIVVFAFIGKEEPNAGAPKMPTWSVGQSVDIELTVVPSDAKDLACSSPQDFGGKKCEFETPGKAYAPPVNDDKKVFKPYTLTDGVQIIGSGLWAEPALNPSKLPNTRFSVKCKYKVDGKMKSPGIRWSTDKPWFPQTSDWYAGEFSGCVVSPP